MNNDTRRTHGLPTTAEEYTAMVGAPLTDADTPQTPRAYKRTSITVATNLAHYLYVMRPDSVRNTHPKGYGQAPVPVPFTDEDRAAAAPKLRATLAEWRDVDPEGYALWRAAQQDDPHAAPCTYCATCRNGGPDKAPETLAAPSTN